MRVNNSIRSLRSVLLVPTLQCVILGLLEGFWNFRLVARWQWGLVLLAAGIYLVCILQQLWKIKRFPRYRNPGLNHETVHPSVIFLIFSWCAIVPVSLPLFWSSLVSEPAATAIVLTLASLFGCWLFLDNEWTLRLSIGWRLFRMWFVPTLVFACFAAFIAALSSNPDWFRYGLSIIAFASIARTAVSVYLQEIPVETAVPYFIVGKP